MKNFAMKKVIKKSLVIPLLALSLISCGKENIEEEGATVSKKPDFNNAVYIYSWAEYFPLEVFASPPRATPPAPRWRPS